ncbi:uncharacterized protein LTR77_008831 [Saxophila tyrrhenica]|uniref:Importin N-terminal domain-containing protein n=1 Tax=Saxophila tyrrhenica TaxID=1690608 RepID=A0AAV9P0S5_9PEZI|nr:hypothetical protein LTR77_008831 [Saxophila tyrrhenica]
MPSFSIEVAGEASPLTERQLVNTLTSAASRDTYLRVTGTAQLRTWEKSAGYYQHLQSAYLDQRLPVEIRYLAIIQLKNGIDKYWRKTASNAVSKEDKNAIRSRLLSSILNEGENGLAVQNALVIAKIARFEYPHDWPDALTSLTDVLRSQIPPLQLARALLALLHIVKELSTGRLQRTRQNLQAATPEIVHVLGNVYAATTESWRYNTTGDTRPQIQQGLLAMKVLRRLLIAGYEHPKRNTEVVALWQLTQEHLGAFIQIQKAGHPHADLIEKQMLQLAKLHHEMARDHPAAFALLPNSVPLVRAYWDMAKDFGSVLGSKEAVTSAMSSATIGMDGDADEDKSGQEKLALKALLIIRACIKMVHSPAQTFKYRTADDKQEKSQATALIRQDLLTMEFVQEVMEVLIMMFFVFRASDLREWDEEPEEWEKREEGEGDDWEFSLRSCSEKLFLDLAINYKDVLVQPLLQVFYSVASPENENILFKDSVYTAIGLAAPVVHEHLDFDAFIRDVLITEVQKSKPGHNIIRRRAAIILGQWISIKVSDTSRPAVYQIFQHLLNKADGMNDQVVRVTAGRQLKNICESWEFQSDQFMPHANNILTHLMQLIDEVELTETRMALLNTISVIVENLDHKVVPFADGIISMLPSLWEASGDEHLMKQAILTILTRLVTAMKEDSLPVHNMVFPIIRGAVEPGSDTKLYLLDDAMDLWASLIAQTPEPASEEALALAPYLFLIYESGSDNLRKALEMTESYLLLAPTHMVSDNGLRRPMLDALRPLIGNAHASANGLVCNLVEVVVRKVQKLGGEAAVTQTADDLVHVGFLQKLLYMLRGSWIAHCTTGPNRKEAPVDGIVETDYFSILARLILGSLSGFCQAFDIAAPPVDPPHQNLDSHMRWLLEEWFSHFENIGDPSRRKLMCLALTKLLETNQPFILSNLQSLMTVWTDVITELREDEADRNGDSLVHDAAAETGYDGVKEAVEDVRRREFLYEDVVHTTNMPAFVKGCLETAIAGVGGEARFREEWLVNVDRDVLDGFAKLGIM